MNGTAIVRGNAISLKMLQTDPTEKPVAVQLFGNSVQDIVDAAKFCEDKFDIIGSLLKQVIVSKLNLTELNFNQFDEIVASIMLNPPLNSWKPIRVTKRGFYELHLGGIIWEQAVIKGGASDNFNRADENPLAGNWTTVPTAGNCKIVTNVVNGVTTGSNEVYWNAGSFSNDQYSQLIFPTNVANNGVLCRVSTT